MEKMHPVGSRNTLRFPLRVATIIGAFGGFLYAYQSSSSKLCFKYKRK
jgi:hypothetical protein